jgi:hypothetical protein
MLCIIPSFSHLKKKFVDGCAHVCVSLLMAIQDLKDRVIGASLFKIDSTFNFFSKVCFGMSRHKCPLCFRYDNDSHKHLLFGDDYAALITHPDYTEANLSEGSRVCCNHFEPHSLCDQIHHLSRIRTLGTFNMSNNSHLQQGPRENVCKFLHLTILIFTLPLLPNAPTLS